MNSMKLFHCYIVYKGRKLPKTFIKYNGENIKYNGEKRCLLFMFCCNYCMFMKFYIEKVLCRKYDFTASILRDSLASG